MPGLVKIGLTDRDPQTRAAELTRASGVPSPFVIAWCRAVSDCAGVESAVHRMLHDKRVSKRREFFRCEVATARQVIEAAAGGSLGRPYSSRKGCKTRRGSRRRLRRGDVTALLLLAFVAALLAVLLLSPSLPHWWPGAAAMVRIIEEWGR